MKAILRWGEANFFVDGADYHAICADVRKVLGTLIPRGFDVSLMQCSLISFAEAAAQEVELLRLVGEHNDAEDLAEVPSHLPLHSQETFEVIVKTLHHVARGSSTRRCRLAVHGLIDSRGRLVSPQGDVGTTEVQVVRGSLRNGAHHLNCQPLKAIQLVPLPILSFGTTSRVGRREEGPPCYSDPVRPVLTTSRIRLAVNLVTGAPSPMATADTPAVKAVKAATPPTPSLEQRALHISLELERPSPTETGVDDPSTPSRGHAPRTPPSSMGWDRSSREGEETVERRLNEERRLDEERFLDDERRLDEERRRLEALGEAELLGQRQGAPARPSSPPRATTETATATIPSGRESTEGSLRQRFSDAALADRYLRTHVDPKASSEHTDFLSEYDRHVISDLLRIDDMAPFAEVAFVRSFSRTHSEASRASREEGRGGQRWVAPTSRVDAYAQLTRGGDHPSPSHWATEVRRVGSWTASAQSQDATDTSKDPPPRARPASSLPYISRPPADEAMRRRRRRVAPAYEPLLSRPSSSAKYSAYLTP